MNRLGQTIEAVQAFDRQVDRQAKLAASNKAFQRELIGRWRKVLSGLKTRKTPTGLALPTLALPQTSDPVTLARYLLGEGLPGEFPFVNATYPQMYLDPAGEAEKKIEEPTRLFAGLGLAEDTNARFHFLTRHQRSIRLSTAFDGPTLYGMDSDADGVFGKIGEGGVAIDTIDDMERLYAGIPLGDEQTSVSMTINAPAPILLAMFIAAAKRVHGRSVIPKLRGTIQADILKEVQAQNEIIFPVEASLRFLADMIEYTTQHMPRWYPISISGYHIAEAGATPVQQAAYTLSNGFTYVELLKKRGLYVNQFGPRLSFFLDCGLDVEYLVLARVCRKIWAIGMRDVFGADKKAQMFKVHTQTSGRSLIAREFQNNLTRTAIELMLSYINSTNSCHSNSADEPFTTPSEQYVRLAAHAQSILLEESGLFKHMTNLLSGSPGMQILQREVQDAVLKEMQEVDDLGGVLAAITHRYQRSQIQQAAYQYERQIYDGTRPIIGLNRYASEHDEPALLPIVRTPKKSKLKQIERLHEFRKKHAKQAARVLDQLELVVESPGNSFEAILEAVEHCSLGQITERLQRVVGRYRPSV